MDYVVVNIRNCIKYMMHNTVLNDFKVFFFVNAKKKKQNIHKENLENCYLLLKNISESIYIEKYILEIIGVRKLRIFV